MADRKIQAAAIIAASNIVAAEMQQSPEILTAKAAFDPVDRLVAVYGNIIKKLTQAKCPIAS